VRLQLSEDPERASSAQLPVLLRARLPPPDGLLVTAATAYTGAGTDSIDST